jgi:hypothetical protein
MDWERLYTVLPATGNPETRKFAQNLKSLNGTAEDMSQAVLRHFRDEEFYYTLSPPETGGESVDDFLLRTRKGYCEHYASAYVFIMRAAGFPARVVGGYYGGEMNPLGGYLMIRHKDAHAWAEIYVEEKGWVRVDPTAAVNPSRVEKDADAGGAVMAEGIQVGSGGLFFDIGKQVRWAWDTLNYQWYAHVIGYSAAGQRQFLEKFGMSYGSIAGIMKIVFITFVLISSLMILYYLHLQYRDMGRADPVRRGYIRFMKKLESAGIPCPPGTGPLDFADRASSARKDLEKEIRGITALYILLRYAGKESDSGLLHDFLVQVARFRPGK